eukprot:2380261-Amphidinium_carterae.1
MPSHPMEGHVRCVQTQRVCGQSQRKVTHGWINTSSIPFGVPKGKRYNATYLRRKSKPLPSGMSAERRYRTNNYWQNTITCKALSYSKAMCSPICPHSFIVTRTRAEVTDESEPQSVLCKVRLRPRCSKRQHTKVAFNSPSVPDSDNSCEALRRVLFFPSSTPGDPM